MKKYLGIIVFIGFTIGSVLLFGYVISEPKENRYEQENKRLLELDSLNKITLDSLENVIQELIDTIQYESIDTTVIRWPWGREEFYYFKYKES